MLNPEKHESGGSGGSSGVGGGVSSSVPPPGGGSGGENRWAKEETMALLTIRSDMDAEFRNANLKGPLWDKISRKMAELGFARSAKKCREKFENVYKYHKRTKDFRTSDGKTYRFFDQLNALESNVALPPPSATVVPAMVSLQPSVTNTPMASHVNIPSTITPTNLATLQTANNIPTSSIPSCQVSQQLPIIPLRQTQTTVQPSQHMPNMSTGIITISTSSSSTSSDEGLKMRQGKKRKWEEFMEKLMNNVVQKQEKLQEKFLATLEKRERDRVAREEAWKVHEMVRMNREHELLVKERSKASARDEAIIALLQKVTEQQNLQNPSSNNTEKFASLPPPPPPPQVVTQAPQLPPPPPPQSTKPRQLTISTPQVALPSQSTKPRQLTRSTPQAALPSQSTTPRQLTISAPQAALPPQSTIPLQLTISPPQAALATQTNAMVISVTNDGNTNVQATSSRWPKEEIEALINVRTSLEYKYQSNGPKAPHWEEISLAMGKLGYSRNSKRCKEKWENINKYYKKMKESNKKRLDDSKTCPYYNKLEAIYNEKAKTSPPKPENQLTVMALPRTLHPPQQHQVATLQVHNHEGGAEPRGIVTKKQQPKCSVTSAVE